jgi:Tol biopolymer transport system component
MHAGAMTRQDHVTLVDAKTGARSEVLRIPKKRVRPQGFAPDGRWLTLVVEDDHHPVTFVAPFSNGRTGPEASWIKVRDGNADAVWTADGNGLVAPAATDGHSACLWLFHLDPLTRRPTGQQTPLLHLHDDTANLSNLALQRYLAVTRNSIIYALPVLASDLWEGQLR